LFESTTKDATYELYLVSMYVNRGTMRDYLRESDNEDLEESEKLVRCTCH